MGKIKKEPFELLKSWSYELTANCDRVRHLIGSDHWLSDGKHKEVLLMAFLKKYAIDDALAACGFIVSTVGEQLSSGEIDILIADKRPEVPWLNQSDILIVPPNCVKAHIHVKSSYNQASIEDVFNSIAKANSVISRCGEDVKKLENIWSSAFFFHNSKLPTLRTIKKHILKLTSDLEFLEYAPKALFIHPGISISFNHGYKNKIKIKIIEEDHLTMGIFLQNFQEYVNAQPTTELGDLLHSYALGKVTNFEIER